MDGRNFVVILSDIHMGTAAPTVWYRNEVHEKYLIAILEDIIMHANQIREVILLGDIFEFWAYSPNELPPMIDDIINAHPNILGPRGKLCQALSALKGRVVYIPGDHDMNITEPDLNKIKSSDGYTMKYHSGTYIPIYDTGILFTHGHEFTLLNTPYFSSTLAPLPIGYFVSRAIAYKVQSVLCKTPGQTIADFDENGAYGLKDFLSKLPHFLEHYVNGPDFISKFIDAIAYTTGIPKGLQIQVNKTTVVSLNEVKEIYINLFDDFQKILKQQGITDQIVSLNALPDEFNRTYLPWHVKKNIYESFIDIVVMGHTHSPINTVGDKRITYVNTGFMCPSIPKLWTKPITYGIYNLSNRFVRLMKVTGNSRISIQPYPNTIDRYKCYTQDSIKVELSPIHKFEYFKDTATREIEIMENTATPGKKLTFGWSVYNASLEFFMTMVMGVLSKAEELGIDIIMHDQKSNADEMVTGSIDLINKGIDALLIAPYYPEYLPFIVTYANRNHIPVVAIDIGTGGADVAAFIISDNFGGGIFAGEYALILIDKYSIKSTNVAIIKVQETATYALMRGQGFRSVMEANGYTIVAEINASSQEILGYEAMKNILASYENDLAVVFCENGPMTLGAARAIEEAGKKGEIMLIGFDSGPSIIAEIMNGSIQGTIAQDPFEMGEIGVEVASSVLEGIPVIYDDWNQKIILMQVYLIDENGEARSSIL